MAKPLVLYIDHRQFIEEVKESISGFNFPWELTIRDIKEEDKLTPGDQPQETAAALAAEKARQEEKENLHRSADTLIEAGSFEKALKILNNLLNQDPQDTRAAEKVGQLESWLETEHVINLKINKKDYENAIQLLEDLSLRVPVGEGQQRLLTRLNELKRERVKELENLEDQLNHTTEISRKLDIIEDILGIAPEEIGRTFIDKREALINALEKRRRKERKRKEKTRKRKLRAAYAAIIALFIGLFVYPPVKEMISMNFIKKNIETDPGKVLPLIIRKLETKDTETLRILKEKAEYSIKVNKSEEMIQEAYELTLLNKYEQALTILADVKEIFEGRALPQFVIEAEKDIKTRAAKYNLDLARKETGIMQKYLYYARARDYAVRKTAINKEMKEFEKNNKNELLKYLLKEASAALTGEKCEQARYLIRLCFQIEPNNRNVLELREKIHSQCPNK